MSEGSLHSFSTFRSPSYSSLLCPLSLLNSTNLHISVQTSLSYRNLCDLPPPSRLITLDMFSHTPGKFLHHTTASIVIALQMLSFISVEIISNSSLHSPYLVHTEYYRRELGRDEGIRKSKELGLRSLESKQRYFNCFILIRVRTCD